MCFLTCVDLRHYFRIKQKILIPLSIDKQREPQKGDLLLSEPFMADETFQRSVIYLCDHNDDGSFGFILNQTIEVDVNVLNSSFPQMEVRVGYGGPVDRDQLFFIHSDRDLKDAINIDGTIYLGGNYQSLLDKLHSREMGVTDIRFFIGYTGWGPGQLLEELESGSWVVTKPPKGISVLESKDAELWKSVMQKTGRKNKFMSEYPMNPSDN